MNRKLRVRIKKPWIGYPGSTVQQNYAEDIEHGYLLWDISDRTDWDVQFRSLPNPNPYVTISWAGTVEKTVALAMSLIPGSRIRIHSVDALPQKDAVTLMSRLKSEAQALEVTFKTDHHYERNVISSGATLLAKDDLRNPDVIMKLVKEHHHGVVVSDSEWETIDAQVRAYMDVPLDDDEVTARNTTWSLRKLTFDNVFAYGEGNSISFEALAGVAGIFGPNRAGKSSVVGTIMYSLFNTTDRGAVKNLHVINVRKPYCYTRAIINVNGVDYAIERQSVRHENKRGQVHASTALNLFKIEDGVAVDMGGEERKDTERVIRSLIGNPDDFLLTSLSAQDEIKLFISQGSTKRRQILSRFLDLDIFDKMHDRAKNDTNLTKSLLKNVPDRDWESLDKQNREKFNACDEKIKKCDGSLFDVKERLGELQNKLRSHQDFSPVSKTQVEAQRARVNELSTQTNSLIERVELGRQEIEKTELKISDIRGVLASQDVDDIKRRLEAYRSLEASVQSLRHSHERELSLFKQQERSLKILDDVPCGDKFPSCKFIKDAHVNKGLVASQIENVARALDKLQRADSALQVLRDEKLSDRLHKVQKLGELLSKLEVAVSQRRVEQVRIEASLETLVTTFEAARLRLEELEEALKNEENAEIVMLRSEIDRLQRSAQSLDVERLNAATERGRIQTVAEKYAQEREQRQRVLQQARAYELIESAFSRWGIPRSIIASQLPLINAEISKILHGIVDFTIELEADDDSDSMEVYINYGDSRRIIELCSGMEKMIASVAIRVALINVSSLPKTDMFIIDEGFGALDEAGVEACNRLLTSLKRYFRCIIVITHVDGVKDAVDHVIEISKNEKDAYVVYN